MVVTNVFHKYFRLTTNGNDEPRLVEVLTDDNNTLQCEGIKLRHGMIEILWALIMFSFNNRVWDRTYYNHYQILTYL